eukprot:CAMPEP_0172488148 /NCGR_PEP_ID=MMETSP1066-20121228/17541_1 /TAXON_ID=671091 /ORGANISM="Coscinodiscus wailesii, Strain CCMP2513" /LENGTH=528 /DNA_ID=CAMNT_0013255189 /DNA_START=284 /DNA_END=1870 /DNA_ORIENTATION=+
MICSPPLSSRDSFSDISSLSITSLAPELEHAADDNGDEWVECTGLPPIDSALHDSDSDWVECTTLPPLEQEGDEAGEIVTSMAVSQLRKRHVGGSGSGGETGDQLGGDLGGIGASPAPSYTRPQRWRRFSPLSRWERHRQQRRLLLATESLESSLQTTSTEETETVSTSTLDSGNDRWWLIPSTHPYKILWDVLTVLLSFMSFYVTHSQIRDRSYENSPFKTFLDSWFTADIILNFFTKHQINNEVICSGRGIWARYLTSWFVVDFLALVPWENVFVKPIVEMQNKRNFFKKTFFRSKAVMRVMGKLRRNHFKLFGQVARQTRHAGYGSKKLLAMIIKYVPKYVMFFRNMRGAVALRLLRQIHLLRKLIKDYYGLCSSNVQTTRQRLTGRFRMLGKANSQRSKRKKWNGQPLEAVQEEDNHPNSEDRDENSALLPPSDSVKPLSGGITRHVSLDDSRSSTPLMQIPPGTVPYRHTFDKEFHFNTPELEKQLSLFRRLRMSDESPLVVRERVEEDPEADYDSDDENLPF